MLSAPGAAAGADDWPRIWPDGPAQGATPRCRFRDVSAITASAGDAEILRLHSGGVAGGTVAVRPEETFKWGEIPCVLRLSVLEALEVDSARRWPRRRRCHFHRARR